MKTINEVKAAVEKALIGKAPMTRAQIAKAIKAEELGTGVAIDAAINAGTVEYTGVVMGEKYYRRLY